MNKSKKGLAVSCLDSSIKIYNVEEEKKEFDIPCSTCSSFYSRIIRKIVENWKIVFMPNGEIATAGELGSVNFFYPESTESHRTLKTSDIFATSLAAVFNVNSE